MPQIDPRLLALSPQHRNTLQALLVAHVPDAEVWAYGSRVNGGGHDGSDLDLVLRNLGDTDATRQAWHKLRQALQDSALPMLVDVHVWEELPETFRHNIARGYVVMQTGAQ